MTPAQIIATARQVLNDTVAEYRYSTDDLLGYVNDGIKAVAVARPDYFLTIGDFTCIAGQCEQAIDFEDAASFVEVLCHHDGAAIRQADLAALNAFHPGWRSDAAGAATQWLPIAGELRRFYLYPKAPPAQIIDVRYVRVPRVFGLDETITDLPDTLRPALADYVVGMAESRDDEHVTSQRAAQFLAQFAARIKG